MFWTIDGVQLGFEQDFNRCYVCWRFSEGWFSFNEKKSVWSTGQNIKRIGIMRNNIRYEFFIPG